MSRHRGQRDTSRTANVMTSGLRNRTLMERAVEPDRRNAVLPPSQEAIRRAVEANICPYCGKGPFQVVAGHTTKVHGVDRLELREAAGLFYSASITSPEVRERNAERGRKQGPPTGRAAPGQPRRLSPAAKDLNRKKLDSARSDEQRRAAGKAAQTPEARAKRRATVAQRLGPPEHGTSRMYGKHRCRCDICRAGNTARHRAYLDSRQDR